MKIHEYQAKEIFGKYGLPVPKGEVVTSPADAREIAVRYQKPVMVKAQVHVGGRGKAGGIKYCAEPDDAFEAAQQILGMDIKGLIVKKVLVTEAVNIVNEAYVGVIVDRASKRNVLMVSPAGGIDIEQVAAETPEKIMKLGVDPLMGLRQFEALQLARFIYPDIKIARKAAVILRKLYNSFVHSDASLAEINPLILDNENNLIAIDAKMNLDDNGLFKHPKFEDLRDLDAEDSDEIEAKRADLSFVKLEGNIGCCVNGAGLAMATMDLVKYFGGQPANFLDIGGSSSPEKVVAALRIILRDPNVGVILFNIFGGITRCDDVANGIIEALDKLDVKVPIVVRLTGTNEDIAKEILEKHDLKATNSMDDVVKLAIKEVAPVA